jgi:hypothetical protein
MPGEPVRLSDTTMRVEPAPQGKFAALQYTWAEDGMPQTGLLVVGPVIDGGGIHAAWIDSWHMPASFLLLEGAVGEEGNLALTGSYAAPSGPDWGWRVEIVPKPGETFQFLMYNVTPDGEESLAVEVTYFRKT